MKKTGRKIWYGIAIVLSALVLLLSVAGIAGTWIIQSRLSDSIVRLMDNLVNVTQNIQVTMQGFDQTLASMQEITSSISQASTSLSQQVADQGLIATLLPEDKTTQLSDLAATVQSSIDNIKELLSTVQSAYQAIDSIPFISLPTLSQDQIDKFQQSVNSIQGAVDDVENAIAAFRAGASDQISKVTSAADQLGSKLGDVRTLLADLDTRLSTAQTNLANLKEVLPKALILVSVLGSLFLAFVAYSQVEVIRLYVHRWKTASISGGSVSPSVSPVTTEKAAENEMAAQPTENQVKPD